MRQLLIILMIMLGSAVSFASDQEEYPKETAYIELDTTLVTGDLVMDTVGYDASLILTSITLKLEAETGAIIGVKVEYATANGFELANGQIVMGTHWKLNDKSKITWDLDAGISFINKEDVTTGYVLGFAVGTRLQYSHDITPTTAIKTGLYFNQTTYGHYIKGDGEGQAYTQFYGATIGLAFKL